MLHSDRYISESLDVRYNRRCIEAPRKPDGKIPLYSAQILLINPEIVSLNPWLAPIPPQQRILRLSKAMRKSTTDLEMTSRRCRN